MAISTTRRAALAGTAAALAVPMIWRRADAQAPTTVTMWTFLDTTKPGGRETALKQMVDSFEAKNPNVKIRVEPQVWTTLAEKFVLGHNTRNAPDIGWVNAENLGLILNTDAAADLKPVVLDTWSAQRRADLAVPAALDAVTVDGKVLAMPLMAITWTLMYRRDLLAQTGLTPDTLKTWDGVLEAAKRMTKEASGVWGLGLGLATERFSATPAVLATIGLQNGIFTNDCKPRIATGDAERALAWQADLITKHRVTPREAVAMTSDDAIDQFAAGRYGMMIVANSRFEQIQRTAAGWNKDDLAQVGIPGWSEQKGGPAIITGWFAVAWRNSPRLRQAAAFIDHMTNADAMALWQTPGGQVPMLKSLAADPRMDAPANAPLRLVANEFSANGFMMPGRCNWSRTLSDFNLATQQVVLGQRTAPEALRIAERATQERQ
ncbi:MAG: extracellular solute-binding protein [Proteobacteria bacterium]|nr:extracellular solute-binding protein [Pseudomonadota bacterium]